MNPLESFLIFAAICLFLLAIYFSIRADDYERRLKRANEANKALEARVANLSRTLEQCLEDFRYIRDASKASCVRAEKSQ